MGVIDEKMKEEIESHFEELLEGVRMRPLRQRRWPRTSRRAGAHLAGDTATAVSAAEIVEFVAADILAPLGGLALVIWSGFQVIDAFKSERRMEELQGFVYGVMWEAMNEPDHLPKFAPGMTYSAEEHEEAFVSGVARGREKARDPKVRNRIIIAVAIKSQQTGFGDLWAGQQVLSEIWRANREHTPGDTDRGSPRLAAAARPDDARLLESRYPPTASAMWSQERVATRCPVSLDETLAVESMSSRSP